MPASKLLADTRPLRESAAFRRLWIGTTLSAIGGQMTTFAVALQVYQISGSSAAVGGVGLAFAVPAIIVGIFSGTLIDSMDRRTIVLFATSLQAMVSIALAAQAFAGVEQIWLLYLLIAFQGGIGAVNAPARRTFAPRLLPRDQVSAGAALTMVTMYLSMISGPALAGLITDAGGLRICYLIDAISFGAALYGVGRLPAMRPEGQVASRSFGAVIDGLRFIGHNRVLLGALLADLSATVLAMPVALFPAINADRFGGSAATLGLLTTALAVGGLLGSVLSGPVVHVTRPGLAMLITGSIWGAALAGFGLVQGLAATLALLGVAGAADVLSVVFRTSILQLATPDELRGRVSATEFVVGGAFPQLGNFRAGVVASATSPGVSAFSGGVCAIAGAGIIALALPALVHYRPLSAAQPERR